MAADEIHVDDVGTVMEAEIKDGAQAANISTATEQKFIVKKPDGTCVTWDTSFVDDGSDGLVEYTSVADDFDQKGEYQIQFYLVMPGTINRSDIGTFTVHPNLDCD